MNLLALPAFTDNPIPMLHDGRNTIAVAPGDAASVDAALNAPPLERELAAILVIHHDAAWAPSHSAADNSALAVVAAMRERKNPWR